MEHSDPVSQVRQEIDEAAAALVLFATQRPEHAAEAWVVLSRARDLLREGCAGAQRIVEEGG